MKIGNSEANKAKLVSLKGARQFRGPFSITSKNENFFIGLRTRCERNGQTRLGIVITKKVCPRAVDRNRLRRVIKESTRVILCRYANIDVVVKVRASFSKSAQKKAVGRLSELLRGL